jgi:hypothetical protein
VAKCHAAFLHRGGTPCFSGIPRIASATGGSRRQEVHVSQTARTAGVAGQLPEPPHLSGHDAFGHWHVDCTSASRDDCHSRIAGTHLAAAGHGGAAAPGDPPARKGRGTEAIRPRPARGGRAGPQCGGVARGRSALRGAVGITSPRAGATGCARPAAPVRGGGRGVACILARLVVALGISHAGLLGTACGWRLLPAPRLPANPEDWRRQKGFGMNRNPQFHRQARRAANPRPRLNSSRATILHRPLLK